jgi:hypothetical protein
VSEQEIKEIELSISFGQRLVQYQKKTLEEMCRIMHENDKIRQHFQSDKSYICDIVQALELGEGIQYLYPIKKRLTIVGQMFFKKEFQELKLLNSQH